MVLRNGRVIEGVPGSLVLRFWERRLLRGFVMRTERVG